LELHATADELTAGIPDNIRQLIEQQIQGLQPCDQRILEAASVAGPEFCAAAISSDAASFDAELSALVPGDAVADASGNDMSLLTVERRCVELARQGLFLLPLGTALWPDGTLSEQFHFSHHLYQEVLYERIPASQRGQLHRQVGERLEQSHSAQASAIAPELAMHFMQGREPVRAVHYLQQAAEQALKRNAYREVVEHLCNALNVLRQHAEFPQRAQREWELQSALAPALIAINGWMTPEVEQAYHRARVLSEQLGDPVALASAIYGLATVYEVRGDYEKAQQLLEERLHLLQDGDRKVLQAEKPLLESHELMACSLYHQGCSSAPGSTPMKASNITIRRGIAKRWLPSVRMPAWAVMRGVLWRCGLPAIPTKR
jgi:predicted ATPase